MSEEEKLNCAKCQEEIKGHPFIQSDGHLWCEICHLREENPRLREDLQWEKRYNEDLRKELKGEKEKLATEREGLISWMESRRAQQQQILDMPMAKQTKQLAEVEIGFIERYLEVIRSGKHRNNNPAVSVPDEREFKSLRTLEREDIERLINKNVAGVRQLMSARPEDKTYEGAEHALITLLDQIVAEEHRD